MPSPTQIFSSYNLFFSKKNNTNYSITSVPSNLSKLSETSTEGNFTKIHFKRAKVINTLKKVGEETMHFTGISALYYLFDSSLSIFKENKNIEIFIIGKDKKVKKALETEIKSKFKYSN